MKKWVSPTEKSNFLKWFIEHHQLKRTDARKVIQYIINHFHILENVTFTEKIILREKTIVISSVNSDEPGFVFYHNHQKTDDISKALGSIMMNPADKINIIVHFHGKSLNQRYLQLVEKNDPMNIKQYEQIQRDAKEVDEILEKVLVEKEIEILKKEIDDALDQKNEVLFIQLSNKLKQQYAKLQS